MSEAEKKIPRRDEIDPKYLWNLADIFPTQDAWEAAFHKVEEETAAFARLEGHVAENPREAIRSWYRLGDEITPVYDYAFLAKEADNGDQNAQAMTDRARGLYVRLMSAGAFLEPELLEMPEADLLAVQNDPDMSDYSEFVRRLLLQKPHTLTKGEEAILAQMGEIVQGPDAIFSMLTAVDMKFPDMVLPDGTTEPLTEGTFSQYREALDRDVRKQSFEHIFHTYGSYGNTISSIYSTAVKSDVVLSSVRHYASARQAAMEPLEIPEVVYDNLISVMHESLPILDRYLELRKKAMGVDELHMYDLYAPIVSDYEMNLPFEKAFQLVLDGLKPMGEDYLDKLREAHDHRWMDVYPTLHKSSGAFSSGSLADVHPYVLLNHNDNLDSAFTIAHELGHSMHSYYSNTHQPSPKRDYSLFVAEVASTCNEAVMMRYLLTQFPEKKAQAFLLNHFLEQFRTTCFRQTMFAEFEKIVHDMAQKGQPLTQDTLNQVYLELNKTYYGRVCDVDDFIKYEWMRIPHFYRAFYVYVYATGLCAAISLSEKILTEGERAVKDYRKFLSAGCSVPPIEALKLAGIDMSSPEPLREAMKVFSETLDRFEEAIS